MNRDDPTTWEGALCAQVDPDQWFPEKGVSTAHVKRICLACEHRPLCLEYALDKDIRHGVWGGMSEKGRRDLKKARKADDEAAEQQAEAS